MSSSAELPGGRPGERRSPMALSPASVRHAYDTGGKNTCLSITAAINLHEKRDRDDRIVEKKKKEPILAPPPKNNPVTPRHAHFHAKSTLQKCDAV